MMTIKYNIANRKKILYRRFILILAILLVLSLGFATVGVLSLSTTARRFQDKKEELRTYEDKLRDKNQKNKENNAQIAQIRKRWSKEIKFANALIRDKTFPFLEKLGKLEELLPAGVYISKIALETDAGSNLRFSIAAISSARLTETYNTFLPYDLGIKKENKAGGLYKADLQIKLD